MEVVFQPARLNRATNCARLLSVAGLETQQPSWRIRDPQAVSPKATERSISLPRNAILLAYRQYSVYGGMGREPKKTPPSVPCFGGHSLAATRSALSEPKDEATQMIYTFIIARPGQKLSQLKRIRTVSAFGRTEAEARRAFKGLPLVLKSRTPDSQEVTRHV